MAIANISNNALDIGADRTCLDSMNNEVKIGSGAPLVSNADSPALYNATTAFP